MRNRREIALRMRSAKSSKFAVLGGRGVNTLASSSEQKYLKISDTQPC